MVLCMAGTDINTYFVTLFAYIHTKKMIINAIIQQQAREVRQKAARTRREGVNIRRRNRLWLICSILVGVGFALILYALRSSIDLFYTPVKSSMVSEKLSKSLKLGNAYVSVAWSCQVVRDSDPVSNAVNITFTVYDAEGEVNVSYHGILPDLFKEGQGVVVQGELQENNHILAKEVLAKHDENYTPPEVEKAMQENHRRPAAAYKDNAS